MATSNDVLTITICVSHQMYLRYALAFLSIPATCMQIENIVSVSVGGLLWIKSISRVISAAKDAFAASAPFDYDNIKQLDNFIVRVVMVVALNAMTTMCTLCPGDVP